MGLCRKFLFLKPATSLPTSTAAVRCPHILYACATSSGERIMMSALPVAPVPAPASALLAADALLSSGAYRWYRANGLCASKTTTVLLRFSPCCEFGSFPPERTPGTSVLVCCWLMKSKVVRTPTSSSCPSTGARFMRITASRLSMDVPSPLPSSDPELPTTAHELKRNRLSFGGRCITSSDRKCTLRRWGPEADGLVVGARRCGRLSSSLVSRSGLMVSSRRCKNPLIEISATSSLPWGSRRAAVEQFLTCPSFGL
mmetsp:Transcript_22274/g.54955  ORF Transcript_22274/g.54955 Transcript_22274/m.54955 type:complete len:257 (+) Transcript_22274:398-1168(+)